MNIPTNSGHDSQQCDEPHVMSCTINILEDGFSPENQAINDAMMRERGAALGRQREERFMQAFMGDDYESPEAFEQRMAIEDGQRYANNCVNYPYGVDLQGPTWMESHAIASGVRTQQSEAQWRQESNNRVNAPYGIGE